jgi:hypothetical protein
MQQNQAAWLAAGYDVVSPWGVVDASDMNALLEMAEGTRPLPSYDVGTPYVQGDQIAKIHSGEMVVDAESASVLRNYGIRVNAEDSKEMVNMLEEQNKLLREQVKELKALVRVSQAGFSGTIEVGSKQEKRLAEMASKSRREANR